MNILITGANGFIGCTLCVRMFAEGWRVRGAVKDLKDFKKLPTEVEGVKIGDIGPETEWLKALNGVDAVVHLAARVHVMNDAASDQLAAFRRVNVKGTERLARTAAALGCRRFVFMSSVKVNGERTGSSGQWSGIRNQAKTENRGQKIEIGGQEVELKEFFSEEDVPEPQDPYAISKWEAEQVLHGVAEATGLEMVILRPPLVYGPGVKANFLHLLETVALGIPLPFANVNNRRSLIYLENLVDAVATCISSPKAAGQTYLVSDGEDVSTPELIRRVGSALERPARMFPFPTFFDTIGR